jgi:tetratricopeptide (TPR) repeat protein
MTRFARLVAVACCCATVACGKVDPDATSPDWEEQFNRANKASAAGQHDQAIAIGEAYLEKHPGSIDGHLMVADALAAAGQAASDANRVARFEQAATHYRQVVETTADSLTRLNALRQLVELHGVRGLKKLDEAERLARRMATESSGNVTRYENLVYVQTDAQRFDAAVVTLGEARKDAGTDVDGVIAYGFLVYNRVGAFPAFPAEPARRLVADAVTLTNTALATDGSNLKLLRNKGLLLQAHAGREPDATRRSALAEEAKRAFEEHDRLEK